MNTSSLAYGLRMYDQSFILRPFVAFISVMLFGWSLNSQATEPTASQLAFFEGKVRPLLTKHCFECHSAQSEKAKGGLMLDTKEAWQSGGDSGEVIEPGNPNGSLLIESVRYKNSKLQMPPKYQLSKARLRFLKTGLKWGHLIHAKERSEK